MLGSNPSPVQSKTEGRALRHVHSARFPFGFGPRR